MKQGYEYKNGKVIVYNDIVGPLEREYQDNIEEILNKENQIEFLESELKTLRVTHHNLDEILNSETISRSIVRYFMNVIIATMSLPIAVTLISKYNLNESIILLGGVKGYLLTFTSVIVFGLAPFTIKKCNEINQYKKEKKSIENQIEYIEGYLNELDEELLKLNTDKTKENKPTNTTSKKLSFNNIKVIKALLELIEDASIEEKKYLEYIKKGILTKKLSKYYEEKEIKAIECYLENKSKVLEKKQ